MRKLERRYALLLHSALAVLAILASAKTAMAYVQVKVLSVVDGDTINVLRENARERVIFYGIDCPERDQPFGDEARKFTDDRCWKKTVSMDDRGRDSKGRTIAVIFLSDGTNLNQELVKQGLAWWSDKYAPQDATLKQLHAVARAAHTGLWADANPVAPWLWRNGQQSVQGTIRPKQ